MTSVETVGVLPAVGEFVTTALVGEGVGGGVLGLGVGSRVGGITMA